MSTGPLKHYVYIALTSGFALGVVAEKAVRVGTVEVTAGHR